jgi:hypothetical protein
MPDVLYKNDGIKVRAIPKTDDESTPIIREVQAAFPWFKESEHRTVGEKYLHEVIGHNVYRFCVELDTIKHLLPDREFGACHRLFDMDTNKSVLYTTEVFIGEDPEWLPEGGMCIGETFHFEEFGRDCSPELMSFKEMFFVTSPEEAAKLGIDTTDVNKDTVYSALVVDGAVHAYRRYTNFVEADNGVLANWQLLVILYARRAKRNDIIKRLLSLDYLEQQ